MLLRDARTGTMIDTVTAVATIGPYGESIVIDQVTVWAAPGPVTATIYDGTRDPSHVVTSTEFGDADGTADPWTLGRGEQLVVEWKWSEAPAAPSTVCRVYGTGIVI